MQHFNPETEIIILIFFSLQDKEEGDVFEEVDEDKYERIVQNRRKGGDFVVDDGK